MPHGYNHIFDKLVGDDNDFVGIVAYTVYKRQKIEWLKNFEADNGRPATDAEIQAGFSVVSNLPSQVAAYREQAVDLIDNFLDFAIGEQIEAIRQEIHKDAVVRAVKRPFWTSVAENVIAGFVASLITLGAAGLTWVASKGPENLIREAFDHYLAPAAEPPPKP